MFSTVLREAASATPDPFSWARVLTVLVVFAVVWPLVARLRRGLSERRRARWARGTTDEPGDAGRHHSAPDPPA